MYVYIYIYTCMYGRQRCTRPLREGPLLPQLSALPSKEPQVHSTRDPKALKYRALEGVGIEALPGVPK